VAPDIDALTVLVAQDPTVHLILLQGTDPNQDVSLMQIGLLDDLGDELGSLDYELDETTLSFAGDDYAIQAALALPADWMPADYEIVVRDATGHASEVATASPTPTPALSDDCACPGLPPP
jgi:hypothetical protein